MWWLLVAALVQCCVGIKNELLPYNPVANPGAVVTSGNARFTVLTDSLVRLEYSSQAVFEDRATIAFVNRNLPVPSYTSHTYGSFLVISTAHFILNYTIGQPFSPSTLTIKAADSSFSSWYYGYNAQGGLQGPGILYGTIRSLDGVDSTNLATLNCSEIRNHKINNEDNHCEYGVISRDGWAVVDDHANFALDNDDWWVGMNNDDVDLYFFGYGSRYLQALKDYIGVTGKIAMVPKYITGIWWSRWYNLNNRDVENIVNDYQTLSFPLDVYVLDMDWHTKQGWGGYSWDKSLFPYPADTMNWLHLHGLHVTANLHDDDGVRPTEDQYQAMANALGIRNGLTIPFASCGNKSIAYALEDIVLGAVEQSGMDFWWNDWQQGGTDGGCVGGLKLNPTIWLAKIRGTDHIRKGQVTRGVVLARYGGMGAHRYQVGFSGDVARLTWANLAFQPYFSFTASNVGYGFWSHDLVGPYDDHELHTRWLQWGAFSGVFRTHDRGMAVGGCANHNPSQCAIIEPWDVPQKYLIINRDAMTRREKLIPYIYTAYRQAFDDGVSILRPMYYNWPDFDMAYAGTITGGFGQYMFGDSLLVSPVTSPVNTTTSMASQTIWIPPGMWFDLELGRLVSGGLTGKVITKDYDLSEIPIFAVAGAIIPGIQVLTGDMLGLAQRQYTNLVLTVYPLVGAGTQSTLVYEDDGASTAYLQGQFTWTKVTASLNTTFSKLTISKQVGMPFPEFPPSRSYTIQFVGSQAPTSITVNGQPVGYSRTPGVPNTWRYDGATLSVIIQTTMLPTNADTTVVVNLNSGPSTVGLQGILSRATKAKSLLDRLNLTPGSQQVSPAQLNHLASVARGLEAVVNSDLVAFNNFLIGAPSLYQKAVAEILGVQPSDKSSEAYLLWSHAFSLLSTATQ